MRIKVAGNKADMVAIVTRNNDPNLLAFKAGAPLFFISNATLRGLDVKVADGLAAAEGGLFAGFNLSGAMAVGDFGESMVFGFYDYARVLLSTRATSTDVWVSYSAIALGDIMSFITTSGVQAVQRSGAGSATVLGWNVIAAQTLVSFTTQASSVLTAGVVGNSTAMVTQLRVFVRAL